MRSLRPFLFAGLLLTLAGTLVACPPSRGGGGGGDDEANGGGGGANGLFSFYNYGYGYVVGRLLVSRDDEDTCDLLDEYGYTYDEDYDFARATIYKGNDVDWPGLYSNLYDEDSDCYDLSGEDDLSEVHCLGGAANCTGEEDCDSSYDSSLRITSYTATRVVGTLTVDGTDVDFSVHNCGEVSYEGRSTVPVSSSTPPPSARDRAGAPRSAWGLRFR